MKGKEPQWTSRLGVGVLTDLDMREGQTKAMKGKRGEAGDGGLWDGDILDAREIQTR